MVKGNQANQLQGTIMFKFFAQLFSTLSGLLTMFDKGIQAGNNLADVAVTKSEGYKENAEYDNQTKRFERVLELQKKRKASGQTPISQEQLKNLGFSDEDVKALQEAK